MLGKKSKLPSWRKPKHKNPQLVEEKKSEYIRDLIFEHSACYGHQIDHHRTN